MQISINVFYKLISSFLVAIARHGQSTQNDKFEISLQYFKKEGRNEFDFLHADKIQNFLQVGVINFGGYGQSCPKCSNQSKTIINDYFYLKNRGRDQGYLSGVFIVNFEQISPIILVFSLLTFQQVNAAGEFTVKLRVPHLQHPSKQFDRNNFRVYKIRRAKGHAGSVPNPEIFKTFQYPLPLSHPHP